MNNPLVTVILTTYNRADWLKGAIESVLNQSYTNWELIIWNDGSTDNTELIVKSFTDSRIKYYYEPNHGMSYGLNNSIRKSKGVYISFIDDDDRWEKDKLEKQICVLRKFPQIDVLFTNFINIDLVTQKSQKYINDFPKVFDKLTINEINPGIYIIEKGIPEELLNNNFIGNLTVMIKKEIIKRTGLFNEKLKTGMDLEFWWRVALNGFAFCYMDIVLATRHWLSGSLSRPSVELYENKILYLELCKKFSSEFHRPDLVKLLNKHLKYPVNMLIRLHGINGNRSKAIIVFFNNLDYGLSLRSIYLLLGSLAGPRIINYFRKKGD